MYAHDSTNVSGQISATRGDSKILCGAEAIGVDHKVAVVLVYGGRF
jgi:hypothetical protein